MPDLSGFNKRKVWACQDSFSFGNLSPSLTPRTGADSVGRFIRGGTPPDPICLTRAWCVLKGTGVKLAWLKWIRRPLTEEGLDRRDAASIQRAKRNAQF